MSKKIAIIRGITIRLEDYMSTPIHKILLNLIPLLEYRKKISEKIALVDNDSIELIESINKQITDLLGIETNELLIDRP